eukprot:scaffold95473_cov35-Prasinocladus_malaysianus.AAC.1
MADDGKIAGYDSVDELLKRHCTSVPNPDWVAYSSIRREPASLATTYSYFNPQPLPLEHQLKLSLVLRFFVNLMVSSIDQKLLAIYAASSPPAGYRASG